MRVDLSEDVLAHFDQVLWLNERTVLQTTYYQQKDVLAQRLHLDSVDVNPSNLEEAPDILENVNEDESELL